ncbi:MAG: hypothetical protein HY308_07155 [Gammaproteobacteria bacterium]|nr:hypothetical protein [Gammaproteobacteria bacterium]
MTIYLLDAVTDDEKHGDLVFVRDEDARDSRFKGQSKTAWKPVQFEWCLEENQKRKNLVINDFVLVTGAGVDIALNEKAKRILELALGADAEYLPIRVVGEESESWYLLNIIHRVDNAVDLEKSHYMELSTGKRLLRRPVFIERNIPDNRVFVYPKTYIEPMVKGEFLKELVAAHNLRGLNFQTCESVENNLLPKSAAG